jgi:hypothetical protein
MNPNFLTPKKPKKTHCRFSCEICCFFSNNKKDFKKHEETNKHQILTNPNFPNDFSPKNPTFSCECGKLYRHKSSLCAHKKKCTYDEVDEDDIPEDLMKFLLKENGELKKMILDVCKNMPPSSVNTLTNSNSNNTNTTNTNSNNKTFNMQFFLNETCKDAMNIMDFVDSIKLQLSDLENMGRLGFVEGMTNIILRQLKQLDVTQRPVHCSDKKREMLMVKSDNEWINDTKENNNKTLRNALKYIANKNILLIPEFKKKYPDCGQATSKKSDLYNKIMYQIMDGTAENEEKIIKKIAKEVVITKSDFI